MPENSNNPVIPVNKFILVMSPDLGSIEIFPEASYENAVQYSNQKILNKFFRDLQVLQKGFPKNRLLIRLIFHQDQLLQV